MHTFTATTFPALTPGVRADIGEAAIERSRTLPSVASPAVLVQGAAAWAGWYAATRTPDADVWIVKTLHDMSTKS